MPQFFNTIRFAFLAIATVSLLAHSGCQPKAETSDTNQTNPKSESDSDGSTDTDANSNSDSGSLVINGDLSTVDWNSMLNQEVTISGDLVVVDTYDLVRYGQVKIARCRLYIPTNSIDPNDADPSGTSSEGGSNVAQVTKAQKQNDDGSITLDDGLSDQNLFPPKLFPNLGKSHPTVRIGSTVNGVTGKLVKERNKITLVPTKPLQWTPAERPDVPDVGNASVKVASFNVLNYFTTLDNGRNGARGADSESELTRQEAKLVAAMVALQADVIGLMEIENNIEAENRLIAALNKAIGKDVYKGCGIPDGFKSTPGGSDSIRVGIIYRTDRVTPGGNVSMIQDDAFGRARTPIVQSFTTNSGGKPFTLVVNHFKSKGGADRANAANKNKGDGQGAYNATRRTQALGICKYIETLKQSEPNPRVLVIGDLNAYGQEDPIDAMRASGLVNLQERFANQSSEEDYSYVYYGQSGSLDHAMATSGLASDVTGIGTWHINADEPRFLDYNQEYNPKALYKADPFRSSDHDPVVIGIGN